MNPPTRILVMDDEAPIRDLFSRFLSEEGYSVQTAVSGREGLKLARAERPDVVLMDVVLPDLGGLEICRLIKADPALADTFVVLFSGQTMDASAKIQALSVGADDFFVKFVCREEFLARMDTLARIQRATAALHQSKDRWQSLVRNSPDFILTLNDEGRILFINRPFPGLRIEQANGVSVYEFVLPEFHYDLREMLRQVIEAGLPGQVEAAISVSERPPMWLLIKATALSREGKVEILVNATDISRKKWVEEALTSFTQSLEQCITERTAELEVTNRSLRTQMVERQEAEQALRESEDRYRSLVASSLDAVLLTAPEGRILAANEAACRMFGLTEQELIQAGRIGVVDATDPRLAPALEERTRTGQFRGELALVRKDSSKFIGDISSSVFIGTNGESFTSMVIRDITERKRAEESLRESEARFASAFENAAIGMALVSPEGRWLKVNDSVCALLGYVAEELLTLTFQDITHPDDLEADLAQVRKLLDGEIKTYQMEKRYIHKTGQAIWCLLSVSLMRDRCGQPLYFISQIQSINERKQAEEALLVSERRLRELNTLQGLLLLPNPIEKKLTIVTEAVVRIVGADFARIWMIEPGDRCEAGCIHAQVAEGPNTCRFRERCLHLMASSGRYTHTDGREHNRVPFGCYIIGGIAATEESKFLTNDVTSDPRVHNHTWARELGLVSFAGYRMVDAEGVPLGVLALFSQKAIVAKDDSLLEGIAHATSLVLRAGRAEEALARSEQRFRMLIERSMEGLTLLGEDGTVLYQSPALLYLQGYTPEERDGRDGFELVHPDDLAATKEFFARLLGSAGGSATITVRLRHKNGSWRWFEAMVTNQLAEPAIGAFIINFRDITERRRTEHALRASEEQYRLLFEGNPNPMWVFDEGTLAFLAINEATVHLYGYTRSEFLAMTIKEIRPDGEVPALLAAIERQRSQTAASGGVWIHRKKDGTLMNIEITFSTISFRGGTARLVMAIDVSERERANTALKDARETDEKASLTKNEFLVRTSYDLRTALDAVLGFVQMLEMDPLPDNQRDCVRCILKTGHYLLELINDILDVPRIISHCLRLSPEPNLAREAVQDAFELIRPLARQRQIHLEADLDSSHDWHVLAYPLNNHGPA